MTNYYEKRYLRIDEFIKFCSDMNIDVTETELEHYEKTKIMFPSIRVIYPKEYVRDRELWFIGKNDKQPSLNKWPKLIRLYEKHRVLLKDYSDLKDEELIDSFDRELEDNPHILIPEDSPYKPWKEFEICVFSNDELNITRSIAEHYYFYWQVYQLDNIKKYPDLYENLVLLNLLTEKQKRRIFRPWSPSYESLRTFNNNNFNLNALSYWITMYHREEKRTFSTVEEVNKIITLSEKEYKSYLGRLREEAKVVKNQFNLKFDNAFKFLYFLLDLQREYQKSEKIKLSKSIINEISYLSQFIQFAFDLEFKDIEDELSKRYPFWIKKQFRHLNIYLKERDYAFDLLNDYATQYKDTLEKYGMGQIKIDFQSSEIYDLLDYCESNGLSILATSLSGMIAIGDEYAEKFREKTRYTNIKNILTSVEYLLKDFSDKGNVRLKQHTLNPVIKTLMKEEKWIQIFKLKQKMV